MEQFNLGDSVYYVATGVLFAFIYIFLKMRKKNRDKSKERKN